MDSLMSSFATNEQAIVSLAKSLRVALAGVRKVMKSIEATTAKGKKGKSKGKGKQGKAGKSKEKKTRLGGADILGSVLFEGAMAFAGAVSTRPKFTAHASDTPFNASEPYLMPYADEVDPVLESLRSGAVSEAVRSFQEAFKNYGDRDKEKRASRRIPVDTTAFADVKSMASFFTNLQTTVEDKELANLFVPRTVGVVCNTVSFVCDVDGAASLRASMSGTREVVLFRWVEMETFMRMQGADGDIPIARINMFVLHMSTDVIKKYTSTDRVLLHTFMPEASVLYVPAAFLMVERTHDEDACGVRQVGRARDAN
eukprot:6491954-Amphidinium_carterae.2